MSRRGNGEGTYNALPSGRIRFRITLEDGTRAAFVGDSPEDCRKQYYQALAKTGGRLVTGANAKVSEWLDQWLEDHIKPNSSDSPRTYEAYESCVRLRLKPELGRYELGKLQGPHIQRAYKNLAARYSPKSVNFAHNVLHLALESARKARLIGHNPTDDVTPPRRPDGHAGDRALTFEQLRKLDEAIVGHHYEPVWRFLLGTGVRWGEAAALRWSDVDLAPGRAQASISRAATRVKGGHLLKGPKTRKGRRILPLAPDTIAALHIQKTHCHELRLAAEPGTWTDNDLVFPNLSGGVLRSNRPLAEFQRVLAGAGLPRKRLHDLRHTYATLLFARDVHPRTAQDLLGHSRIDMTLDLYTGSVPAAMREAVGRLADVLGRASSAQ